MGVEPNELAAALDRFYSRTLAISEPSTAGSSSSTPYTSIPLDVVEHLLSLSGSMELTHKFRLVCTHWNDVSCRVLRKSSAVLVDEGDQQRLRELKSVLSARDKFPKDWPNPFQKNYHVIAESFTSPKFVEFVKREAPRIQSLDISQKDAHFNGHIFKRILCCRKSSLKALILRARGNYPLVRMSEELLAGSCSSLTTLTLQDECRSPATEPCSHIAFVKALTSGRKMIRSFHLSGNLSHIFSGFFSGTWPLLSTLELRCIPSRDEEFAGIAQALAGLNALDAPGLRILRLDFGKSEVRQETREPFYTAVSPFLSRVMPELIEFHWSMYPLSLIPASSGPNNKLRSLSCGFFQGDGTESVTTSSFPHLERLSAFFNENVHPSYIPPGDLEPNHQVRSLEVQPRVVGGSAVWPSLARQFPQVQQGGELRLLGKPMNSAVFINGLTKWFSNLRVLHLDSVSAAELIGLNIVDSAVLSYSQLGWPHEDICHAGSINQLSQLTELSLGPSVEFSRDMVAFGLAPIPKLRLLTLHMGPTVSLEFFDLLPHLETITVKYSDRRYQRVLRKLSKRIKSLRIKFVKSD